MAAINDTLRRPYSRQDEPYGVQSHNIIEQESREAQRVFSIVVEEFKTLSPEDVERGPTVIAERAMDRVAAQQSGINAQTMKNLLANAIKFALEIPQNALVFISEMDKKRVESIEKQGMELKSPPLLEQLAPVFEKCEEWNGAIDTKMGNTSGPQAYKELYNVLGPVKILYSSSQPANQSVASCNDEALNTLVGKHYSDFLEQKEIQAQFNQSVEQNKEKQAQFNQVFEQNIAGLNGNLEERAAAIGRIEEDLQQLDKKVAGYEKKNEDAKSLAKETEKKQREEKSWENVSKVLEAAAGSLHVYNAMTDRLAHAKDVDHAQTRAFVSEGRDAQEALARDNRPVLPQISTGNILLHTKRNEDSIGKIKGLLGEIDGFLKERRRIADSGDSQVDQLTAVTAKIEKAYKKIKKEEQKVRESFGIVEAITGVISKVLYTAGAVNPAFIAAGAAVSLISEGIHAVGSHEERHLKKEENYYADLSSQYNRVSSGLGDILRENHGQTAHLEAESEFLYGVLIQELQRDPAKHLDLIKTLDTQATKKREALVQRDANIQKQKGVVANKQSDLLAAQTKLTNLQASNYTLKEISLKELKEKDAALVKKHGEGAKEIWWDKKRNLVVILKNGKYRVYQIGHGAAPQRFENKKMGEVMAEYGYLPITEHEANKKKIEQAEADISTKKAELSAEDSQLAKLVEGRTPLESGVENLEKSLEHARKLQPIQTAHAEYKERYSWLLELLGSSENPVVEKALDNMGEAADAAQATRQVMGFGLSRVLHLAQAIDGCIDTRRDEEDTTLSEKVHTPVLAISRATTFITALVQFSHGLSQVNNIGVVPAPVDKESSVIFDSKGKALSFSDKDIPKKKSNIWTKTNIAKLAAMVAIPGSDIIIAGLEFCALFQEQQPTEMQQLAKALQDFHSDIRKDIQGVNQHLRENHVDILSCFTEAATRINLLEESITQQLNALGGQIEGAIDRQTVDQAVADIVFGVDSFKVEIALYEIYLKEELHLEERDFALLFSKFRRVIEHSQQAYHNGTRFNEREPLNQLTITANNPEHYLGLLSQHMGGSRAVPNLYEHEQYTHMFSRLGAKVLLDGDLVRFRKNVLTQTDMLIAHGSAIERFFDQELLLITLDQYQQSQLALIEALQGKEATAIERNKGALVTVSRSWLQKHQDKRYLVPTADEQGDKGASRPRLMASNRFMVFDRVYSPIATRDIQEIATRSIYLGMLYQRGADISLSEWTETLGPTLASLIPCGSSIGHGADYAAYCARIRALDEATKEVKKIQKLSLVQLFTSSIPKITVDERGTIKGNFLEVAYKIDSGLRTCVRLCNNQDFIFYPHSGERKPILNELHRSITFPDPEEKRSRSKAIDRALTQNLSLWTAKSFNELFVFSVVQTAEAQDNYNCGLAGKTFIVLSKHINEDGIKRLIMMQSGLGSNQLSEYLGRQQHFHCQVQNDGPVKEYTTMPTTGDGACALHSLLGVRTLSGRYHYNGHCPRDSGFSGAKYEFTSKLSRMLSHSPPADRRHDAYDVSCTNVKDKLTLILKNHLNSALGRGNLSSIELFPDTRPPRSHSIKDRWIALQDRYSRQKKALKTREALLWLAHVGNDPFMNKVMEEVNKLPKRAQDAIESGEIELEIEITNKPFFGKDKDQVIAISREDPEPLMSIIDSSPNAFFAFLRIEACHEIRALRTQQVSLNAVRDADERRFVIHPEVLDRYLETIVHDDFHFNTEEIELAAMMYNKNALVVSRQGGQILPSENPFKYGRGGDPVVVIYHDGGDHFERCVTMEELNKDFQHQRNLERRHNWPTSAPRCFHTEFNEKHDASIKKLVKDYAEFLDVQEKPIPKGTRNPFLDTDNFSKRGFARILTPTNKDHVPLAFPAAFLDRIERELPVGEFNRVDMGKILLPQYSFAFNEEEGCYELKIEYRVLEADAEPKDYKDYYSFVVAQIGRDTVDAFSDKEGHKKDPIDFFHNEFLIQAMYTNFADEKTLPGQLSFRLLDTHAESVIPIEEKFDGLFQRFAALGDIENLTALRKVSFPHAIPQCKDLSLTRYDDPRGVVAIRNTGFADIDRERRVKKKAQDEAMKEHAKEYKEAQKNYLLLKALLKLVLDKPAREKSLLSIWSPNQILTSSAVVADIHRDHNPTPEMDEAGKLKPVERDIKAKQLKKDILDRYDTRRSDERKRIEGHLANLRAIASHARGEEDPTGERSDQLRTLAASGKEQPFSQYGT